MSEYEKAWDEFSGCSNREVSEWPGPEQCLYGGGRGGSLRERGSEEVSLDNYFWKFGHDEKAGDSANEWRQGGMGKQEEVFNFFVWFCLFFKIEKSL